MTLSIILLILFLALTSIVTILSIVVVVKINKQRSWPQVKGRLFKRGVKRASFPFFPGRTYEADIAYEYVVQGKKHTGTHFYSVELSLGPSPKRMQTRVDALPDEVLVYHHPYIPSQSYLRIAPMSLFIAVSLMGAFMLLIEGVYLALKLAL